MAETTPIISFEYVPQLGQSVYLKTEAVVVDPMQMRGQSRRFVWNKISYSESPSGPWTELWWVPFGLETVG